MRLNLHQLAEDEVVFRFESDEDRIEFFKNIDSITTESSWEIDYVVINNKNGITFYRDKSLVNKYYPTWKEIKEKYMKDKEITESIYRRIATTIKEDIDKNIVNELIDRTFMILKENEIEVAKDILQSLGYTLTPPYIPPTDEEICERIKFENEKARHLADWNNLEEEKFFIYFDNNLKDWDYDFKKVVEILGTPYTTQSIAKQIVAELNEKRFVRV